MNIIRKSLGALAAMLTLSGTPTFFDQYPQPQRDPKSKATNARRAKNKAAAKSRARNRK